MNNDVDLETYKQDNGIIFIPQDMFDKFSKEKKKEIRDMNGAVRRARNKRKIHDIPNPSTIPKLFPRSMIMKSKKHKATNSASIRQGLVDMMDEDHGNTVMEPGTEDEVPAVTLRRSQCQIAFNIASKQG